MGAAEDNRKVFFAVAFYFCSSIVLVMTNKAVLNKVTVPITFLWFQLVIAVVLLHVCSLFGLLTLPRIEVEKAKKLWQLIAINVVGLSFNTLCLQHVDASFFQVARSLVLPFTVIFQWAVMQKPSSAQVLGACAVVVLGFLTGVTGEIHLSFKGVAFGFFSSITTAYHAVVIKASLVSVSDNTMDLVYYNNLLSAICLMPLLVVTGELPEVMSIFSGASGAEAFHALWVGSLVTGLFGFLINIATFLQIQVTNPVTHMISSAARGVAQTILGAYIFSDVISAQRAFGIFLVVFGSTLYTWVKHKESQNRDSLPTSSGGK